MKTAKEFQLKRPFLVWFIGCCFIVAGPANVIQVLLLEHISGWYEPSVWLEFFARMPLIDQAVCASLPIAGFSLLIQRKNSWLLAVTFVLGACVQNLYAYVSGAPVLYPVYIPMVANAAVLVVFYYFRYPYLDRRDQILRGVTKRYPVELPVQIDSFSGVMAKSISAGGCFLKFSAHQNLPKVDSTLSMQMDGITVEGTVLYHRKHACGISFKSRLTKAQVVHLVAHSKAQSAKVDRKAA